MSNLCPEHTFSDGTRVIYRNLNLKQTNEITDLTQDMREAKSGEERLKATVALLRMCVIKVGEANLDSAKDEVIMELDHQLVKGILAKMAKIFPPLD